MEDRAKQALMLAMEPEWEAMSQTVGFRAGRAAHDAIEAIFKAIGRKVGGSFALDADIRDLRQH